ncbi:MAG: hypothetical protein ACFHU9_05195 [Fluviicola sp.]
MLRIHLFILVMGIVSNSFSQNLEKIGEEDMVTVNGGINYNLVANQAQEIQQFRDPFTWVLSGNVSVNILDVSLPFTFSFSNAGRSFTQPFNMTAIHPTYKNWKAHLGITSMSLSPYTFQGLNFAGAGVEYTPNKWHIKAFGGRIKKAVEFDALAQNQSEVSYQRYGFGVSAGYKWKIADIEVISFKAYDDATSIQFLPQTGELTARDNVVFSVKSSIRPTTSLSINLEAASSLMTQDILASDPNRPNNFYDGLVRGNQTTQFNNAFNGSIDYKFKSFGIGAKYERIDPDYATLGAVYFNNDLENITINPSLSLFKKKVNINVSTGYQRNNLDNLKVSDSKRWIGSANVSALITKGLNFSANYSNMSFFTRRNPSADPFFNPIGDTLNYYQVSQNLSSTLNYSFGDSTKQNLTLTGSYAQSENITGRLEDAGAFGFNVNADTTTLPVNIYNGVLMHRISLAKSGVSIGWSANANHSILAENTTTYIGPGVNASKRVKKWKLGVNTGVTYNQQLQNSVLQNHVLNYRLGLRFNPEWWDKKYGKLSMSLNGAFTDRLPVAGNTGTQNVTLITNISLQF